MDAPQIVSSLTRLFKEESERIVFWYDANREFEDNLKNITIDGITIVKLDQIPSLELKILLELTDTKNKYLIYAPFAEPEHEKDWLLDIRLYSRTFYADIASIILDELNLTQLSMREHLINRLSFFRNQERLKTLKKWVSETDLESDLDRKMIAVLVKADQPEPFAILMKLFGEFCNQEVCNLSQTINSFSEIEKYNLTSPFWEMVARNFGYSENQPNLVDLLMKMLVTDFALSLKTTLPKALKHFQLTNKTLALSTTVFLSQWRSNVHHYPKYNLISSCISTELKLVDHLTKLTESELVEVMTFEEVEKHIASCLRDHIINDGINVNLAHIHSITKKRCDGHWVRFPEDNNNQNYYKLIYDAILAAAELLSLRKNYGEGFSYPTASVMYQAYVDELYRFDQLYRLFHEAANLVDLKGGNILKQVRIEVDNCYNNWFISQLAISWGIFIDNQSEQSLLKNWQIDGIKNQQHFYSTEVAPLLKTTAQSKVYVIISDAFRFEVAQELTKELNGKNRFKATLKTQLGVLPSYTALGMAAMLPHTQYDYKNTNSDDLVVDGQPATNLEQRSKILSNVEGVAIKATELSTMNTEQGREFVKPWRVIYIYHNQIDATGDSLSTEENTFAAARIAIKELFSLTSIIINRLNGSQVLITADHGFLFQETPVTPLDKSRLEDKPNNTVTAKKRYLLGTELEDNPSVWHGDIKTTAGIEGSMEFWIPKGTNRFHFVGGARFIHGGAMLQEIVVPIIFVKGLRGQQVEQSITKKVGISILGSSNRVVNNLQTFNFIQTEPISERVKPITLLISLQDEDNKLISNEVAITFDSSSQNMDERKKSIQLTIKAGQYDKKKDYYLILRDAETQSEQSRITVIIDLAFMNDF